MIRIAVVLVLCSAFQDAKKVPLEWKFKAGQTIRYEMSQSADIEQGGQSAPLQRTTLGLAMEVTEVGADGTATIATKFDRVKLKPQRGDTYDSDVDKEVPNDSTTQMFAGLIGRTITLKMTPRGEILKVEGLDKALLASYKTLEAADGPAFDQLAMRLNDSRVRKLWQIGVPILPKESPAVGGTWDSKNSYIFPQIAQIDLKNTVTLKEVSDAEKTATIETTSKTSVSDEEGSPYQVEVEDKTVKGKAVWSTEEGLLKSSSMVLPMNMTAGGQEMTITLKLEMKLAPREKK